MKDERKTKEQLITELEDLRKRIANLEASETRLKSVEREIQRVADEQAVLLRAVPAMIFWTDKKGRFIRVNDAFASVLDKSPEDIEGKSLFELYPEDMARKYYNDNLKVMKSASSKRHIEEPVETPTGKMWVSTDKIPYRDQKGDIIGIIGFSVDITERKRSEEALRASENKYRTLLENLPQKIFHKDKNSVYVSCNQNYARDLKIKPDEIVGKTDYEFYPKELAEKYRADDKRIMRSGKIEDIEERYIQDGQEVIVHTVKTPIKDKRGKGVGILGIFWDITERKRMQDALRESEDRFATFMDHLPGGAAMKDGKLRYIYVNKYMSDTFGAKNWLNRPIKELFPKQVADKIISADKKALKEGLQETTDTVTDKNGVNRTFRTLRFPILRQGKPTILGALGVEITKQVQAENALIVSEKRFKELVNLLPQTVFETDERGNIRFANVGLVDRSGYTENDYKKGLNFGQVLVAEDRDRAKENMRRRLIGENFGPIEYTARRKDGSTFPVLIHSNPIIRDNKVVGLRGIAMDITDIKQAQYALRESEEKYRILAENSLTGIFIHQGGKYIFVNNRFAAIHGYTSEELLGKPHLTLIHPDDRETIKEITSMRVKEKVPPMRYEIRRLRKDGKTIWCEMTETRIIYRGKPAIMGNILEITERKVADKALRESENKYRNLFENAYDAIFITDAKTSIILDTNRKGEELLGRPKEEIIGMHQSKLHPTDHYEHYKLMFRRHMRKGGILDLEAEVVNRDGGTIPVLISASVIKTGEKEVIQGIFRDITKERRIVDLQEEIEGRMLVERAKEILMNSHKISEKDAMRMLQKESRRQSRKIREIARDVISARSLLTRH